MIDAATIGITLALNDGVSEGIARIRHDLANLDTAVASASLRLTQLTALAAGAGQAVAAGVAATTPSGQRPPATAPLAPEVPGPDANPGPVPPASPVPQVAARMSAPLVRENAVATPTVVPPEGRDFASFGRGVAVPRLEEARPRLLVSTVPVHAPAPRPGPVLPSEPAVAFPPRDGGGVPREERPPRDAVAPIPMSPMPSRDGGPDAPDRLPRPADVIASNDQRQPTAVEITLDGSVLARWLSAELGQQASRPPAGSGAFDPRLSPNWFTA